ncbi:hypothetical protein [Nocardioides sp. NPDC006273]|uniref:hypothetical protein n=1 Tax=Nocardioides sp. NPDC006273 TaxID=3155598 RepID=UPI0033BC7283
MGAIAIEAHIGSRHLDREILPIMETLGWIGCRRGENNEPLEVEAFIPPNEVLINDAARILDQLMASPLERAALVILRATSLQPLTEEAAKQAGSVHGDEAASQAIEHLAAVGLLRRIDREVDRPVLFNPNIWTNDEQVVTAALRADDARASAEVGALLEEVSGLPGIPEKHVTSTEKKWIDFAVSQGLVDRSIVQTSDGVEEGFLFSPHLKNDPFGAGRNDPSGHVRQLVGSMIYAATFATWKLHNPSAFLSKLIRDGEAGNVRQIGTDYPMLETAGTIRVAPGTWNGAHRMILLQSEVAEAALEIIDSRIGSSSASVGSLYSLGDQRSYAHVEAERARMAAMAETSDSEAARLVAALRDVASGGSFGA